ncbi:MAG: M14 family metallopeptidase [bacterium]
MSLALAPYCSPETRDARLRAAASAAGGEVLSIGTSREGRAILAARVPAAPSARTAGRERVLVCAGIHGLEYIGCENALALIEGFASPSPELARLRDRAEVWVLPSLNPDGYARTWEEEGRGPLKALRTNARGVDLNRNFPLPAPSRPVLANLGGWRTGSDDPANAFYRGAHPLSEPETRALAELHRAERFAASANLHSTWGTLIPPLVTSPAHHRAYRVLCGAFSSKQRDARYRRLSWASLDRYIGEQEDFQHHELDSWALCVEHYPAWVDLGRFRSRQVFWRFNPRDLGCWLANDAPGIVAFLHTALDLGRPSTLAPPSDPRS